MVDFNAMASKVAEYGLAGIVIIALAWVVIQMNKQYREDVARLQAKNDELQEKRIAESRESTNALNNSTNVLNDVLAAVTSISRGKAE